MLNIINELRRLCLKNNVRPEMVKITIEFLDSKDAYYAEATLLHNVGLTTTFEQVRNIVDGKEFSIMGFKAQTKVREEEYLANCMCPVCQSRRQGGNYKINPHAL